MDSKATRPEVSDWDREYMKRLGRYIEEANEETLRRHLANSGAERTESAVYAMLRGPYFPAPQPDDDDPSQFYQRARQLGLYRG